MNPTSSKPRARNLKTGTGSENTKLRLIQGTERKVSDKNITLFLDSMTSEGLVQRGYTGEWFVIPQRGPSFLMRVVFFQTIILLCCVSAQER